jgi:hypothetical protein
MSEDVQALRRSLRAATRGRASIDGAEDLAALVDDLEKRGCIRRVRTLQEGPGPRSPRLEIHPDPGKAYQKYREPPYGPPGGGFPGFTVWIWDPTESGPLLGG